MFCTKCGQNISGRVIKFCPSCGGAVSIVPPPDKAPQLQQPLAQSLGVGLPIAKRGLVQRGWHGVLVSIGVGFAFFLGDYIVGVEEVFGHSFSVASIAWNCAQAENMAADGGAFSELAKMGASSPACEWAPVAHRLLQFGMIGAFLLAISWRFIPVRQAGGAPSHVEASHRQVGGLAIAGGVLVAVVMVGVLLRLSGREQSRAAASPEGTASDVSAELSRGAQVTNCNMGCVNSYHECAGANPSAQKVMQCAQDMQGCLSHCMSR